MKIRTWMWGGVAGLSAGLGALGMVACSGGSDSPPPQQEDSGALDVNLTPDVPLEDAGDADAGPLCTTTPCAVEISAGSLHTCARFADNTVRCWGLNTKGETGQALPDGGDPQVQSHPMVVPGLAEVQEISAGGFAALAIPGITCVRRQDGTAACFGGNEYQMLGRADAGLEGDPEPAPVDGLQNAVALAAGEGHSCAMTADGGVVCWGTNSAGQLGRLPLTVGTSGLPVDVVPAMPGAVTQVKAGYMTTCGILESGSVACFGDNASGYLGIPDGGATVTTPSEIPNLSGVTDIVNRYEYRCALVGETGAVACWGSNPSGVLGRGDAAPDPSPQRVQLPFERRAVAMAGGEFHACALLDDGSVWCWGANVYGMLGTDPDAGAGQLQVKPVKVLGLPAGRVLQLALGTYHSCALIEGGSVYCWGGNTYGQLGRGDVDASTDLGVHADPQPVLF
jgi:alpha-tubulin suppressor-like RCC1 family protein